MLSRPANQGFQGGGWVKSRVHGVLKPLPNIAPENCAKYNVEICIDFAAPWHSFNFRNVVVYRALYLLYYRNLSLQGVAQISNRFTQIPRVT